LRSGPDQFTFSSDREGPWELYVKTVNSGPGQVEKLPIRLAGESYLAGSWSPEGETLVFTGAGKEGSQDIFTYTTGGQTEPFLNSRFGEVEFKFQGRAVLNPCGPGMVERFSSGAGKAIRTFIRFKSMWKKVP